MNLLHIDSSILGQYSASRELSALVAARIMSIHPDTVTVYRDLDHNPVAHLSGAAMAAATGAPADAATAEMLRDGETVMTEFLACDMLLLGSPMYNFTVSSQLKSWFDRIAIAGKTFKYNETGVVGLMGAKRAVIVSTRGNTYTGASPNADLEHHERWLRTILGFVGLVDVQVVRAEGLALSPENRERAMTAAKAEVDALQF